MNRITELEGLILYHKALYYQGRPEISDFEYDRLEDELKELAPQSSVLSLVGTQHENNKIKHDRLMLSLNKTYDVEDLCKWINNRDVVACLKIDGISCSVIYKSGVIQLAKTRGDGEFGEDITEKVKWMNSVPNRLNEQDCEVRGELYITEKNFKNLRSEMLALGLEVPTSKRNIVAGLISRKENVELCRYINFLAFDFIGSNENIKSEVDKNKLLNDLGFCAVELDIIRSRTDIEEVIEKTQDFMAVGDYQIDGVVFSLNELSLQNELGETAHHPRYKMAYKFAGESKVTTLLAITWQVSRNGILTPVGEVSPVELSGAQISRVTLHNWGVVRDHQLKVGDEIEIIRSGEVIPKFLKVSKAMDSEFLGHPAVCPSCKKEVVEEDIRIVCVNEECPDKKKEEILFFLKNIGIENLSDKRLNQLLESKIVSKIPDIYNLSVEKLVELDKVKSKLAEKLVESIQKSKKVDLLKFLMAIGISGGAKSKCQKVIDAGFNTLEKIKKLTPIDLRAIEGFAEKSAKEFSDSLREKHPLIEELVRIGVEISDAMNEINGHEFESQQFCITGALSRPRKEIEDFIKKHSGKVTSSVTSKTTYLVTNEIDSTSSKFVKAKELGVLVITEDELYKMVF